MTNDQTVTQALDPCPLCQSSEVEFGGYGRGVYCIICKDCCIQTKFYPSRDAAATAWNTRTAHSGEGRSNGAGEEDQLLADANSHYSSVQIEEITARHRKLARDHTAPDDGVGSNLYGDTARMLAALSAPQGGVERLREALPSLDTGLIEAAMRAHYGKTTVGIDGLDLTANDRNWSFRDGFTRMWDGVRKELKRRAALAQPEAGGER